ncbi:MAG: GGDEF domain-containing protein [Lachnospiraceae bacterium]|nr:GGDEF domain-containing protein [Lachnospiraceae bacterium]
MDYPENIKQTIETAIRSMYQMIVTVSAKTLECRVVDHNPELRNISDKLKTYDSFCDDLYANIHPADREGFLKFTDHKHFPDELKDKVFTSYECRIRHTDKRYYWSKIIFCNATEEDRAGGQDYLFLIEDVHELKQKELKEDAEQRAILKELQDKYTTLFEENMKDAQTGCYNRKGMKYYTDIILDEAKKTGNYIFVCVADLNGLKHLNDTYGHAAGDEAIAAVSAELLKSAPKGSRIVRTGGDEFLLMAALPSDSKETSEMEIKIEKGMQEYNDSHPHPYTIGVSYGWVLMPVRDGMQDIDEYVETADAKMYEMKMEKDEYRRV